MHARSRFVASLFFLAAPLLAQSRGYGVSVRSWHAPVPDRTAPTDDRNRTMLVLASINTQERLSLDPLGAQGGWSARELDRAAHVLREPGSGAEHPIEPRLLDAVYRIQMHFAAQEIRFISGYRAPATLGRGSNHGRGRAMDIIVPGATDDDVAKLARDMGFMGVGIYPTSGFVHVDVRDRSYFWIDYSGPGRRNRERGILADVAARADREATARGDRGLGASAIGGDVTALLGGAVPPAAPVPEEDED